MSSRRGRKRKSEDKDENGQSRDQKLNRRAATFLFYIMLILLTYGPTYHCKNAKVVQLTL